MSGIRRANVKDYQTIIEIMRGSVTEEEVRGFAPIGGLSTRFFERLKQDLKRDDHGVLIADVDDKPVGFAYYHEEPNYLDIEEIDVKKEWQGKGIGRSLVAQIEVIAKEKGINQLQTGTSTDLKGKRWVAYGFWMRMGFIETGETIRGAHGMKYVKMIKEL